MAAGDVRRARWRRYWDRHSRTYAGLGIERHDRFTAGVVERLTARKPLA